MNNDAGRESCWPLARLRRGARSAHRVRRGGVHADDRAETDHLLALAAGAGRLSFFRCDLLDGAALLDAARGCSGVFHLASPCTVDPVKDPQVCTSSCRAQCSIVVTVTSRRRLPARRRAHTHDPRTPTLLRSPSVQNQLMVPAVEGTLNVVRAAKDAGGVRRVVVTSSISAVVPNPGWPAGEVVDERCWADIDYCEKNGVSIDYCSCLGSSSFPIPPSEPT
jgi:hypothetical protein